MTKQTLYSLRTHLTADGDRYFITKFVDGEVESAYACTPIECECPAGVRPSCRHRQMLPQMLAHGLVNTHWFWDFDLRRVVDFNGELKSNLDALNELAQRPQAVTEDVLPPGTYTITQPDDAGMAKVVGGAHDGHSIKVPTPSWRRI